MINHSIVSLSYDWIIGLYKKINGTSYQGRMKRIVLEITRRILKTKKTETFILYVLMLEGIATFV